MDPELTIVDRDEGDESEPRERDERGAQMVRVGTLSWRRVWPLVAASVAGMIMLLVVAVSPTTRAAPRVMAPPTPLIEVQAGGLTPFAAEKAAVNEPNRTVTLTKVVDSDSPALWTWYANGQMNPITITFWRVSGSGTSYVAQRVSLSGAIVSQISVDVSGTSTPQAESLTLSAAALAISYDAAQVTTLPSTAKPVAIPDSAVVTFTYPATGKSIQAELLDPVKVSGQSLSLTTALTDANAPTFDTWSSAGTNLDMQIAFYTDTGVRIDRWLSLSARISSVVQSVDVSSDLLPGTETLSVSLATPPTLRIG